MQKGLIVKNPSSVRRCFYFLPADRLTLTLKQDGRIFAGYSAKKMLLKDFNFMPN